jgi:hypothetical protein
MLLVPVDIDVRVFYSSGSKREFCIIFDGESEFFETNECILSEDFIFGVGNYTKRSTL